MERHWGIEFIASQWWDIWREVRWVFRLQYDYITLSACIRLTCTSISQLFRLSVASTVYQGCIVLSPAVVLLEEESLLLFFFFLLHCARGDQIMSVGGGRGEKNPEPVAAAVFLRSSCFGPRLCLSLYRLPSQGSNLPGLAGTWLKIR